MIEVKMTNLLNSTATLQKLAKKDLKARLAWQVARILKSADKEINDFNETRMNLITKYGEKDEKGELVADEQGNCKIVREQMDEFSNQLNELLEAKVEINANKIRIEDIENIDFTPSDMSNLEPFIEFDDAEEMPTIPVME